MAHIQSLMRISYHHPSLIVKHKRAIPATLKRLNSSSLRGKIPEHNASRAPNNTLGIVFFSSICLTALGLGCWQTKRYFWKVNLMAETAERYNREASNCGAPISDPILLSSYATLAEHINSIEGEKMSLTGYYDHSKEVLVGPRAAAPGLVTSAAQGMATNPQGYTIFTPFRLSTGGHTIFVNRGWVAKRVIEENSPKIYRPTEEVELPHLVASQGEQRKRFTPENDEQSIRTRKLLWAEPLALEMAAGVHVTAHAPEQKENVKITSEKKEEVDPISQILASESTEAIIVEVIEADDAPITSYPIARRYKHLTEFYVSPLTHFTYAVTWFSLAAAGFFMTHRMFRVKTLRNNVKQNTHQKPK